MDRELHAALNERGRSPGGGWSGGRRREGRSEGDFESWATVFQLVDLSNETMELDFWIYLSTV